MNRRHQLQEAARDGLAYLVLAILAGIVMSGRWEVADAVTTLKWLAGAFFGVIVLLLVALMVNSGRISREEEQNDWRRK